MSHSLVTDATQRIHNAVHQLAQLEIDLGRYDSADQAAAKGIGTDSRCERCWDLRLAAARAAGDDSHLRHLEEQRHRIAEAS